MECKKCLISSKIDVVPIPIEFTLSVHKPKKLAAE